MRYRLRTLLIVITVAATLFARIAYLKRMGDNHRKLAAQLVPAIAISERASREEVEASIRFLAMGESSLNTKRLPADNAPAVIVTILENSTGAQVIQNGRMEHDWRQAVLHLVMAAKYERAVFRPWLLVTEPE